MTPCALGCISAAAWIPGPCWGWHLHLGDRYPRSPSARATARMWSTRDGWRKKARSDHHYFEFADGNWVLENAAFHLALTEGLHSWVHMHGIDTLTVAREVMDYNLTGWLGDHYLGARVYDLMPDMAYPMDDLAFETQLFFAWSRVFSWPGFREAGAKLLFTNAYAHLNDLAFESLRQEAAHYLKYAPELRLDLWTAWHHSIRLTHNYVGFMRSHIETRYPFADYALVDFLVGLPVALRKGGRLHRELIIQMMPELAKVPYANDGMPLTNQRAYQAAYVLARKARSFVNQLIRPTFAEPASLYADYEAWLRTDLRAWGEGLLFDERTLARGIFDPTWCARCGTGILRATSCTPSGGSRR
ncbi:MAG: asparagine synthase-related protein [Anaerolineae bacterium]|nr:asparagine synthase-related protein [Anaerolineae bacterium]